MDYQTCTKEKPMPKGDPGRWAHPDAEFLFAEDGSLSDGGSYDRYECPNCGKRFWVEIPD
jgi:hypothetical protein